MHQISIQGGDHLAISGEEEKPAALHPALIIER